MDEIKKNMNEWIEFGAINKQTHKNKQEQETIVMFFLQVLLLSIDYYYDKYYVFQTFKNIPLNISHTHTHRHTLSLHSYYLATIIIIYSGRICSNSCGALNNNNNQNYVATFKMCVFVCVCITEALESKA